MSTFAVSTVPMGRSASTYASWNGVNELHVDFVSGRESTHDALEQEVYNISSNPPNPKLSFRAGDWW